MRPEKAEAKLQGYPQPDVANRVYVPSWRRAPLPRILSAEELKSQKRSWLVFTSQNEFGSELIRSLEQQGQEVIAKALADFSRRIDNAEGVG